MKVVCNEGCKQEFMIDEFKNTLVIDDIEKTFFTCPHCGKEYVAFYTDQFTRGLQGKMQKLLKRSDPTKTTKAQKEKADKQIKKLKENIKNQMDELRLKIEQPTEA